MPYLKANIEGGEKFNWFYNDGDNGGRGLDPNGSDLHVSLPEGDRLAQSRNALLRQPANPGQQAAPMVVEQPAPRGLRRRLGLGSARAANRMGAATRSRSLLLEYGIPGGRQGDQSAQRVLRSEVGRELHALLVDLGSGAERARYAAAARRHDPALAMQAIYEYWVSTATTRRVGGLPMLQLAFSCVWNWDARPFPVVPDRRSGLGRHGQLAGGRLDQRPPDLRCRRLRQPAAVARRPIRPFRRSATLGWSVHDQAEVLDDRRRTCLGR